MARGASALRAVLLRACGAEGRIAGMGLGTALLLAGCAAKEAPPPPPPPPPAPPHAGPPPAASCTVSPFHVTDGGSADIAITMSNEGGYCAARFTASNGRPFDAPLVPVAPEHGIPRVVKYAGQTSVEYAPKPGFVGHDNFTVKLILRGHPGYTTIRVNVDVK